MAIIGIVVGMIGAMVGVVVGLVGGSIGLVLGFVGGLIAVMPHTIPVVLIVLGVVILARGSRRQNVAPAASYGPAAVPQNPNAPR